MTAVDCKVHGKSESDPDQFGVVMCRLCRDEMLDSFRSSFSSMSMVGLEALESVRGIISYSSSCLSCGMEVPDNHCHTAEECTVHSVMDS